MIANFKHITLTAILSFSTVISVHATDKMFVVKSADNTKLTFQYGTPPLITKIGTGTIYLIADSYTAKPAWCSSTITSAVIDDSFMDAEPTSTAWWFAELPNLKSISGLEYLNSSNDGDDVVDMSYMFYGCSSLTSVPGLSSNSYSNCEDISYMFADCKSLKAISMFSGGSIVYAKAAFSGCSSLTTQPQSDFSMLQNAEALYHNCAGLSNIRIDYRTDNLTNAKEMFSGCSGVTSMDLSRLNTASVTNMEGMFNDCRSLTAIDLGNFDTSSTTNMNSMFYNCRSLASIDVSKFNTAKVTDLTEMFCGCSSLQSLDISSWDFTTRKLFDSFCSDCSSLQEFKVNQLNIPEEVDAPFYGVGENVPCRLVAGTSFNQALLGNKTENSGYVLYDWGSGMFYTALVNDEKQNYSATFKAHDGEQQIVTTHRTFAAGKLNTICLPFDVSITMMSTIFGSGYQLLQLYDASKVGNKLTLYFTPTAGNINAGTPYLLTVKNTITDPTFNNVTLDLSANVTKSITYDGGTITFHGVSFPTALTNNDKNTLFFKNNTLYYPSVTDGDCRIYGMHGYFTLSTSNAKPEQFDINVCDTTSRIMEHKTNYQGHHSQYTYNLSGQRVNDAYKGIVIWDGHKYINR